MHRLILLFILSLLSQGVVSNSKYNLQSQDSLVATVYGSQTLFYNHVDRQNNVRVITDHDRRPIEFYSYTPYGERTIHTRWFGQNRTTSYYDNSVAFTGRYHDKETGLYYFRARYYDSEQGRFISRDPAGYVDGMGLYNGYFASHFGLDPSGMKKDCPCKNEKNKIKDDAGRSCCPEKIKIITLNADHGKVGHVWLNTPKGSYGHYPASPVSRLGAIFEWGKGKGESRKGETQSPDFHQTTHDKNKTKPSVSKKYKVCPETYKKLQNSIKNNSNKPWSVPNNPAPNCVGWACKRLEDSGIKLPLDSSKSKLHPNDVKP